MKKGVSISLILLMTAAMLHISVATHYCGGKIAASTVSLTGKLANCGMENSENELPFPGIIFSEHCCDDILTLFETSDNYIPSFTLYRNRISIIFRFWINLWYYLLIPMQI